MSDYMDKFFDSLGNYIDPDTAATIAYGEMVQYGNKLRKEREAEEEAKLRKSIEDDLTFEERLNNCDYG